MYTVPKSKAEDPDQRFEFQIDGVTYTVPKLGYLSGEKARFLREAEESEDATRVLEAKCRLFGEPGTPVGDAVARLEGDQLDGLVEAYQEDSKITAGESSASTDS